MSGHVSENGVFLNDRTRVKKVLEEERRKLRLNQVREESKNLARKIRNDVAAEKQRQLQNLQAIKEQELELWRRSMLARKYEDYREAFFHIGDAHAAARAENEAREAAVEARRKEPQESLFRKQVRARRTYGKYIATINSDINKPKPKSNNQKSSAPNKKQRHYTKDTKTNNIHAVDSAKKPSTSKAFVQRDTAVQVNIDLTGKSSGGKRKRHSCNKARDGDTQYDCLDSSDSELDSCCRTSHCSLTDQEKENDNLYKQKLTKTSAVLMEVESNVIFGEDKQKSMEVKDNFVKDNRQFSHVVHGSSEKRLKSTTLQKQQQQNEPKRFSRVSKVLQKTTVSPPASRNLSPVKARKETATALREFPPINPVAYKYQDNASTTGRALTKQRSSKVADAALLPTRPVITQVKKISTFPVRTNNQMETQRPTTSTAIPTTSTTSIVTPRSEKRASSPVAAAVTTVSITRPAQSLPSPAKILREKSPTPRPSQIIVVEQQQITTAAINKENDAQKIKKLNEIAQEREEACRDLKLLTDKLAALAQTCLNPTNNINKEIFNDASTYRKNFAEKSPIRSQPTTPKKVASYTHRASSTPTTPISKKKVNAASTTDAFPTTITTVDRASSPIAPIKPKESSKKQQTAPTDTDVPKETKNNETVHKSTNKPARKPVYDENLKKDEAAARDANKFTFSSVLQDYVADQTKLLCKNLNDELLADEPNREKCEQLQKLLQRNDKLHRELIAKLDASKISKSSQINKEEVKRIMNDVCEVRRQRESILKTFTKSPVQEKDNALRLKEIALQKKEQKLAEQLKELQQLQQDTEKSKNVENATEIPASADSPVEIVITVKGAKPLENSVFSKNKDNLQLKLTASEYKRMQSKDLPKVAEQRKPAAFKSSTPKPISPIQTNGENTYDSNSTHYRTLPQKMQVRIQDDNCTDEDDQNTLLNIPSAEEEAELICRNSHGAETVQYFQKPSAKPSKDQNKAEAVINNKNMHDKQINPLLAQYVDRLLNMRRSSVRALGVSASDVETPSTSVVNRSSNQRRIADELRQSQREMTRVERFVEENRSFIEELERTLVSQKSQSLDKSVHLIEQMWSQYLQQEQSKSAKKTKAKAKDVDTSKQKQKNKKEQQAKNTPTEHRESRQTKPKDAEKSQREKSPVAKFRDSICKTMHSIADSFKKDKTSKPADKTQTPADVEPMVVSRHRSKKVHISPITAETVESPETRIRFAELSTSCSQRIDELNEMLARVREEKQRLRESTFSSVSIPSPEPAVPQTVRPVLPAQQEITQAQPDVHDDEEPSTSSLRPLPDRQAAIGGSRDSGICMSRPITRQEQTADQQDVLGPESVQATTTQNIRHNRPPPVLNRFSPQLEEDMVPHELSTIAEVDTPITNRLSTAATTQVQYSGTSEPEARPFPAFEQYLQSLNLDLTCIDPELSLQLAEEFTQLIQGLRRRESQGVARYSEFPELSAYLQQISHLDINETSVTICEQSQRHLDARRIEELINCLRLANMTVKAFPTPREYAKGLQHNSPNTELLASASLDNLTETESDTLNIEQELRKRKLLRQPFHNEASQVECINISVISRQSTPTKQTAAAEETVSNTTLQQADEDLGAGTWVNTMRRRMQEANALSSDSTTPPERPINSTAKSRNKDNKPKSRSRSASPSAGDDTAGSFAGREMNLRDFLTRELSRYCNTTTSSSAASSSMDLSLRQQFFQSILDSMTPQTQPTSGTAETAAPDNKTTASTLKGISSSLSDNLSSMQMKLVRQKTSTPVHAASSNSRNELRETTTSTSELFSCESHISCVPKAKRKKKKEDHQHRNKK